MDFEKAKKAYDSMSWQEQQKFAEQNKNNAEFQQFANQYLGGNKQTPQATQPNNPAPVEDNQQNQDTQDGQNWGNNGWIQSSQNQETEQTQGMPQQPAPQDSQNYQFWYWTTEEYRKQRDTQFAQQLYQSNPNTFDYNAVFNYVKSQAPQVSQGEISNTVKNIQRQWLQHSRIGMMGTASVDQIRNGILNGQFSQSDLEILRTQNPEKYQEYLAHDEKLNAMSNAKHNANLTNKLYRWENVKEERSNQDLIMEAMEKFFGNINYNSKEIVESYKQALNSPEIQRRNSKVLTAQREMDEIDEDLDTMREDLTRQYPWISKTQLNQILYDRSYKAMRRKNELHRDYIMARGETQFLMNLAEKNFEADMKWVELQRAEFTDKYNALGFAKGILEFETPQQKRQAELDQIRKKAQLESELNDINSKDPKIQFNALMKALEPHYKEFGSIILRPQAQVAQDILALAKKEGISVGEAMRKNFTEELYKKPEYRAMMNKAMGIQPWQKLLNIWGKPYIQTTNADGTITISQYEPGNATGNITGYQWPDYTPVSAEKLQKGLANIKFQWDGSVGGQCGSFVNDYLQNLGIGRIFSDPIHAKKSAVNSSTPSLGSVAVIDWTNNPNVSEAQRKYGHVGVVIGINKDGSIILKQSNKNGEEKVFTSTYRADQIYGYFDPTISKEQATSGNGWTLTSSDIISYNDKTLNRKLSAQDKNRIGKEINRIMSDPNADINSILEYSAGGKVLTDSSTTPLMKYQDALNGIGTLSGLLKQANTGPIVWILRSNNPYDQKAREIQTVINQLVPTLARGVYWEVWVLTDADIKHYSQTVPNLQSTEEVNNAILALTLNMLAQGYKNKLRTLASAGNDVSRFWGIYNDIMSEVDSLLWKVENTVSKSEQYWGKDNVIKTSQGNFRDDFTY